jgi:hypothetical protein
MAKGGLARNRSAGVKRESLAKWCSRRLPKPLTELPDEELYKDAESAE